MPEARGNLGNWSELLALASIIVNRGAHGPLKNDSSTVRRFFRVLEIYLKESNPNSRLHYLLDEDGVTLIRDDDSLGSLDLENITENMNRLLSDMLSKSATRHFSVQSGQELLKLLGKSDIGASSNQRVSDFELVISDPQTGNPSPRIGYSVKSSIGSAATLLNASGATNFVYEVTHPDGSDPRLVLSGDSLKGHINQLLSAGCAISYRSMSNATFEHNLMRVDSLMPHLMSEVLLNSLRIRGSGFAEVVEYTYSKDDPIGQQRIFKMKQLLGSVAMGLRPSEIWDGDPTKFKGIIVVDSLGNIIFNYQFNQIEFWDYLYSNLKFEIPSRSRHGFGYIYEQDSKFYLKLNLQIRFIK